MTALVALLAVPQAAAAEPATAALARLVAEPTVLSLTSSPRRIGAGDTIDLDARLATETGDNPVPGETVGLQWRRGGTTGWRTIDSAVTTANGRAQWEKKSRYSGKFRAVFAGDPAFAASTSPSREVNVKPVIRAALSQKWVRSTGSVKLSGKVAPAYKGERVDLQRKFAVGWRTVSRSELGGRGGFAFRVHGTDVRGPSRYRVQLEGRAKHLGAASRVLALTTVRVVTYRIETRGDIVVSMKEFRQRAQQIYDDRRGWSRAYVHFKRVRTGGAFSLVLSEARFVPTFAPICDRYWSCRVGRYVIINQNRWRHGTPYFKQAGGNLREYRAMVVNHETGHWFGLGHASCGGAGKPAPVMMQQSKGLFGCKPNPWPLPGEIARVR